MLGGLLGVSLSVALATGAPVEPARSEDAGAEQPAREQPRFRSLELDARGLEEPALRSELELRLPDVRVYSRAAGSPVAPRDAPYVYISLRRDGGAHAMTLITSDGHVYERVVPIEDDEPERVLASTIANTMMSIEAGLIAPDRTGSAIPEADAAPRDAPAPVEREPPPPPADVSPPRPRAARRVELGFSAHAGALLGPGPPRYGDVFLGAFGGIGLTLRAGSGALALLELRAGGRQLEGLRLVRIRVLAGGGYAWRLDRLELALALALTCEPWIVRPGAGVVVANQTDGTSRGFPPALGAALVFSPGYHVELASGRALRVGPRVELAGGFVLGGDGPTVAGVGARVADGTLAPRFRVGGLELLSAVDVVLWFDVPRARTRRRSATSRVGHEAREKNL